MEVMDDLARGVLQGYCESMGAAYSIEPGPMDMGWPVQLHLFNATGAGLTLMIHQPLNYELMEKLLRHHHNLFQVAIAPIMGHA